VDRPIAAKLHRRELDELGGMPRGASVPEGNLVPERSPKMGADESVRRWMRSPALATVVGVLYFLAAKLGFGLTSSSGFVQVFWPAIGLGVGALIGLGSSARWPVLATSVIRQT
jgi:hypothetical protein